MANEELKIIIDAVNAGADELGKLENDLGKVEDAADSTSRGMGSLKEGLAGAIESVTGLSLESLTLAGAVTGVAVALKDSIEKAANWGDDMGDLAQVTGATVEQTSLMVASFELVGVGADNITQAMKAMTANGMTPNLETMKRLAREYQDIQDPVKQNEFLFKNFGKAGLEMAEIMGKSAEELDRLEQAARSSGKVISEETAASAEELNLQLATLKQKAEGAQIAVGNFLIPVLNSAADGGSNLAKVVGIMNVQTAHMLGLTDDATMRLQAEAVAAGNVFAVFDSSLNPATAEAARLQAEADKAIDTYGLGLRDYITDATNARTATDELNIGYDYTLTATDKLSIGLKTYNEQLLFSIASQGLDAQSAIELGVALGVVDEKSLKAAEGVAELKEKYDSNADGAISAAEAARGYTADILALNDSLNGIPRSIPVRIEFSKVGDEDFGGWTPPKGSGSSTKTSAAEVAATPGMPQAMGGPVEAGGAYTVHPPEIYFSPSQTGFIMSQSDTRALLQMAQGGGGVNISIDARGATDPAAIEAAGYRGAQRALAEAGRSADNMRRTR